MSFKVEFGAAAEAEFDEAFAWYEKQSQGLGSELARAMRVAEAMLIRDPERFPVLYVSSSNRRVHRVLRRRFPYSMHYLINDRSVMVLAFMQVSRDPMRWGRDV